MRLSIIILLPLVLLCALAPPRQGQGQGQDEEPTPAGEAPLSGGPGETNRDLLVRMQGCWRLADAVISDMQEEGRSDSAILLVCEEFMSIEVHVTFLERDEPTDGLLQTGAHRMQFNHEGYLDTTALIGSVGDEGGFRFLPAGERGSYRVRFASDRLVFTNRRDGSRFTFVKIPASPGYEGDFFGRRSLAEPENEDGRR
ncbi:MAG: hypothetical protein CMJ84_04895 [Planctomycetes bacterium]|nr:hypothetical protein [Planctomycetota bacterium]